MKVQDVLLKAMAKKITWWAAAERGFGTWQGRLPQQLRLAEINTVEGANAFLRERYVGEFNAKFSVPAVEKGTAALLCFTKLTDHVLIKADDLTC